MFEKLFVKKKKQWTATDKSIVSHGISPEMNYCPECGDEYRADRSNCGVCDRELISGPEKLAHMLEKEQLLSTRSMEISIDDELATIRKGPLKDLQQLQKLLAEQRIPAILAGDEKSCGKGCRTPELYLQIRKNDVQPAIALLDQDFIESTALSSHDMVHSDAVYVQSADSTVCPACGCRFTPNAEANCPECGLCFG